MRLHAAYSAHLDCVYTPLAYERHGLDAGRLPRLEPLAERADAWGGGAGVREEGRREEVDPVGLGVARQGNPGLPYLVVGGLRRRDGRVARKEILGRDGYEGA